MDRTALQSSTNSFRGRPDTARSPHRVPEFTDRRVNGREIRSPGNASSPQGWLYLASLIDCCTREVIGYAMADHLRTELVLNAVDMAMRNRRLDADCIMHSDRGTQYTSSEYREKLVERGLRHSVGPDRSMLGQCARGIVFREPEE